MPFPKYKCVIHIQIYPKAYYIYIYTKCVIITNTILKCYSVGTLRAFLKIFSVYVTPSQKDSPSLHISFLTLAYLLWLSWFLCYPLFHLTFQHSRALQNKTFDHSLRLWVSQCKQGPRFWAPGIRSPNRTCSCAGRAWRVADMKIQPLDFLCCVCAVMVMYGSLQANSTWAVGVSHCSSRVY